VDPDLESLMRRLDGAESGAADQLFALLYDELHRLAERNLRRAGGVTTLGTTTLLHEAYLNMSGRGGLSFPDRTRFLAYASRAMRGLVVDFARRRRARKRGREFEITLTDDAPAGPELGSATDLEQLGDALEELGALDQPLAQLVDLHFFGGFSFGEIAAMRGASERTVQRDWRKARLLLHRALLDDDPAGT
jgi:RNA polymerase sigma factor (TIGR02999 family)